MFPNETPEQHRAKKIEVVSGGRLAASAQFSQILVPNFTKTAAKKFRYDAEVDAPDAS